MRDGGSSICEVEVARQARRYPVYLVEDLLGSGHLFLASLIGSSRALIVTTPTVARLYARRLYEQIKVDNDTLEFLVLECTEQTKVLDQVAKVSQTAAQVELGRKGVVVGVGGGVVLDIATFAASWIHRGIDHIRVPTTLIGLVDAGLGIKGAVNFGSKKSYIGCSHPPRAVVLNPQFLRSLPDRFLRCGLAEVVKIALMCDPRLFGLVETHGTALVGQWFKAPQHEAQEVISRSVLRMLEQLQLNFYEDPPYERVVDFGHTFSPLLESASGFSIHHGEAVAVDMALSAALATNLGLLAEATRNQILAVILDIGLPVWSPLLTVELCQSALAQAALHRGGNPNLILPTAIGESAVRRGMDGVSNDLLGCSIEMLEEAASTSVCDGILSVS